MSISVFKGGSPNGFLPELIKSSEGFSGNGCIIPLTSQRETKSKINTNKETFVCFLINIRAILYILDLTQSQ